ncbi:MAG: hypothetical protein RI826_03180 [Chlorobium phaeovibrioides]|nr:hypothetical protein [Chlorobium phaeovibrioides]
MNKILIVGHPQSGYGDVEKILLGCGMQAAEKSRNEGLSAQEIGSILCKAHGHASVDTMRSGGDIQQIEAGPVWNGLALDLLMNNIDQQFWGWSDPQAIALLDYWKLLDPKMAFMLVYDEPQRVLREMGCDEARHCSREMVKQRLESWNAYNGALLAFYLRNQDRCMLVNAQQVRRNTDAYLNQLQPYLGDQVLLSPPSSSKSSFRAIPYRNGSNGSDGMHASAGLVTNAIAVPVLADGFLVEGILSGYPEHMQRYEELQASASIPMENHTEMKPEAVDAWLTQMKRRSESGRAITILTEEKQRIEQKLVELGETEESLKDELASKSRERTELSEENDLLLAQLHQVQEELERYYLENEKNKGLAAEKASVENKRQALEAEKKTLEQRLKEQQTTVEKEHAVQMAKQRALAEEKQSLESKLQAMQQQVQSLEKEVKNSNVQKELTEENELLLAQLHQVQEELERYYLENQKLKQEQKPAYYGAADRLKSELPYQLGAAIIERSRQVWPVLFLPVSLSRIARDYRKQEKQQATDLPPLNKYRDYPEAERVQKHLSYRLGEIWLKHSRTPWGWAAMPFALTKAYREFRTYRTSKDN